MYTLLLIDNLSSGGAQRQIVTLARLFAERGERVRVVAYHNSEFFEPYLSSHEIPVSRVSSSNYVQRILRMRRFIRGEDPDAIIAYLDTPSMLAEIASLPRSRFRLVVSERRGMINRPSLQDRFRFHSHRLADAVVANSGNLHQYINRHAPWLREKTHTIVNCVDLEYFARDQRPSSGENNILVVGRIRPEKNTLNLIKAVHILKSEGITNFVINWYGDAFLRNGRRTPASGHFFDALSLRNSLSVNRLIRFHKPIRDVRSLYHSHAAVCLASFFEGFSNVLGEAAASGLPLLASDVCDNPLLVRPQLNGLLFQPNSPESIARSIREFLSLPNSQRQEMGHASRRLAEELLSPQRFADQYLDLLARLGAKK